MKTLVFITSQFPFGSGESFIDSEFPVLSGSFDKIIVISQNVTSEKTRDLDLKSSVYRYDTSTSISGFLLLPLLLSANLSTIRKLIKQELSFRKNPGNHLTTKNFFILLKKIIKVIQLKDYIKNILKKEAVSESIVFYSYWLKTGASAISLLNYRNSIKIARAHGSDIYEEKTAAGYLPLLGYTALSMNAVFFASRDGKEYIERKIKAKSPDFLLSYLGVTKPDFGETKRSVTDKFVIVSCSNMIPLKRIDLLIKALETVKTDKPVEWLHFGDGILRKELEEEASLRLTSNSGMSFRFMGHYPNNELMKFYNTHKVDLFINTSSTEGLPVSIMEAQAYGIPVIATDTGGVREIVVEGTGSLLPVSFLPEELSKLIIYYTGLNEEKYEEIKGNAIRNRESNFDAASNYRDFIIKLNSIFTAGSTDSSSLI
jgi:glycosyltransferase involved in cell wall biosynthesis